MSEWTDNLDTQVRTQSSAADELFGEFARRRAEVAARAPQPAQPVTATAAGNTATAVQTFPQFQQAVGWDNLDAAGQSKLWEQYATEQLPRAAPGATGDQMAELRAWFATQYPKPKPQSTMDAVVGGFKQGLGDMYTGAKAALGFDVAENLVEPKPHPDKAAFDRQFDAAIKGVDSAKGAGETLSAIGSLVWTALTNPKQSAAQIASSAASVIPGTAATLAGLPFGPVGATATGFAGEALINSASEITQAIKKTLGEKGVDLTNAGAIGAALRADPSIVSDAVTKGAKSGLAIASVEAPIQAAGAVLASKIPGAGLLARAGRTTANTGAGAAAEGGGSAAGQYVAEGTVSAGQVAAEALYGGLATLPLAALASGAPAQPQAAPAPAPVAPSAADEFFGPPRELANPDPLLLGREGQILTELPPEPPTLQLGGPQAADNVLYAGAGGISPDPALAELAAAQARNPTIDSLAGEISMLAAALDGNIPDPASEDFQVLRSLAIKASQLGMTQDMWRAAIERGRTATQTGAFGNDTRTTNQSGAAAVGVPPVEPGRAAGAANTGAAAAGSEPAAATSGTNADLTTAAGRAGLIDRIENGAAASDGADNGAAGPAPGVSADTTALGTGSDGEASGNVAGQSDVSGGSGARQEAAGQVPGAPEKPLTYEQLLEQAVADGKVPRAKKERDAFLAKLRTKAAELAKAPEFKEPPDTFKPWLLKLGIAKALRPMITGEKSGRAIKGVPPKLFRPDGLNLDMIASRAVEQGYLSPSVLDDNTDTGGTRAVTALIERSLKGEPIRTFAETDKINEQRRDFEAADFNRRFQDPEFQIQLQQDADAQIILEQEASDIAGDETVSGEALALALDEIPNEPTNEEFDAWYRNEGPKSPAGNADALDSGGAAPQGDGTGTRDPGTTGQVNEPAADQYQQDLFGNPLPQPAAARPVRAKPAGSVVSRNPQPAANVFGADAVFATETAAVETRRQELGFAGPIKGWPAALQAMSYIDQNAVERFDVLLTDANGNPVGVIGGFKGAMTQTSVFPTTLVGELVAFPTAVNAWLVHNHPSGTAQLSTADRQLTRTIASIFEAVGVTSMGIAATANDKGVVGSNDADVRMDRTYPLAPFKASGVSVPVLERQLVKRGALEPQIPQIINVGSLRDLAQAIKPKGPMVIAADARYRPVASMPITQEIAGALRTGQRYRVLQEFLARANASSVFVLDLKNELGEQSLQNLGSALEKTDVKLVDALIVNQSATESGRQTTTFDGTFRSARAAPAANRQDDQRKVGLMRRALEDQLGTQIVRELEKAGLLKIVASYPDPTAQAFTQGNVITVIAGNIDDGDQAPVAVHEAFHAFVRGAVGARTFDALLARMGQLDRSSNTRWMQGARERVGNAKDSPEVRNEELAAYAIENRMGAPADWRTWVEDFMAAIRVGIAKLLDAIPGTAAIRARLLADPASLQRLALQAMRSAALAQKPGATNALFNPAAAGRVLFSKSGDTLQSALLLAVATAPAKAQKPGDWKTWLSSTVKAGKVKPDELEWSGLNEWLDMHPPGQRVTRESVLGFAERQGVRIGATILGSNPGFEPQMTKRAAANEAKAEFSAAGYSVDFEESDDWYATFIDPEDEAIEYSDLPPYLQEVIDRVAPILDREDGVKYEKYNLPGFSTAGYFEMLVMSDTQPKLTPVLTYDEAREAIVKFQNPVELRDDNGEFIKTITDKWELVDQRTNIEAGTRRVHKYPYGERGSYIGPHWDERDVLVHVRGANVEGTLIGGIGVQIFELQSDWGQALRKQGPPPPQLDSAVLEADRALNKAKRHYDSWAARFEKTFLELEDANTAQSAAWAAGGNSAPDREATSERVRAAIREYNEAEAETKDADRAFRQAKAARQEAWEASPGYRADIDLDLTIRQAFNDERKRTPDGPFVGKTDAWVMLGLKRALSEVVENGASFMTLPRGEQAAQMFDLSKQVGSVIYHPDMKGGFLEATDLDTGAFVLSQSNVSPEKLQDYIGKEAAKKLLEQPLEEGGHVLRGLDLQVGGEGMTAFYNNIVAKNARELVKKFGGEFKNIEVILRNGDTSSQPGIVVDDKLRAAVEVGLPLFSRKKAKPDPTGDLFAQPAGQAGQQAIADERARRAQLERQQQDNAPPASDFRLTGSDRPADEGEAAGQTSLFSRRAQTNTPEFKRWFGDSKVVDANGEPLVVYHGSRADILEFDSTKSQYGNRGFYFAADRDLASTYARRRNTEGSEGAVYPVYLSIQNPLVLDGTTPPNGWKGALARALFPKRFGNLQKAAQLYDSIGSGSLISDANVANLRAAGFDGIYQPSEDVWIALEPNQIKSAVGNNGQFDAANPDIRFSRKVRPPDPREIERERAELQAQLKASRERLQQLLARATRNVPLRTQGKLFSKKARPDRIADADYRVKRREPGDFNEVEQRVWDTFMAMRPDADQLMANLAKHKGTPWAIQAVEGVFTRMAIIELASGMEPEFQSQLDNPKVAGMRRELEQRGEDGIWNLLEIRGGMLGAAGKPVNNVNSSFINCNPSPDCANFCYATGGNYQFAPSMTKSELVTLAVELDPIRTAKRVAAEYKATLEFAANKALRLFDKGDGNQAWLPFIKALNDQGIRTHIFSKNPAFLRQVSDFNLRLLSVDVSNVAMADANPDLPVSFVYSGPSQIDDLARLTARGQVQVVLPVKVGQKVLDRAKVAELKAAVPEVKPYLCPLDAGLKKLASDKKSKLADWNCTKCDAYGGIGCYHGQATTSMMAAAAKPTTVQDTAKRIQELRSQINEISRGTAGNAATVGAGRSSRVAGLLSEVERLFGDLLQELDPDAAGGSRGSDGAGNSAPPDGLAQDLRRPSTGPHRVIPILPASAPGRKFSRRVPSQPDLFSSAPAPQAEPAVVELAWGMDSGRDLEIGSPDLPLMPPAKILPTPAKTVNLSKVEPGDLSPAQAEVRRQQWRDEVARIRRDEDHSSEVVFSLFDRTGEWSKPWADAGYQVLQYDITTGQDLLEDFPIAQINDVRRAGFRVVGVLAAPPCTSYASSGARWWKDQHDLKSVEWVEKKYGTDAAKYFDTPLDYANALVAATQAFIEFANPEQFHALENPIGRIAEQNGMPRATVSFDPNDFGDPYTKRTMLWGDFKTNWPTARVHASEGSRIHNLRGDNAADKAARSETPEGFALAFFMANHRAPVQLTERQRQRQADFAEESKDWPDPVPYDPDFDRDALEPDDEPGSQNQLFSRRRMYNPPVPDPRDNARFGDNQEALYFGHTFNLPPRTVGDVAARGDLKTAAKLGMRESIDAVLTGFVNSMTPALRWIDGLPISPLLKQKLKGSLDRAAGTRSATEQEAKDQFAARISKQVRDMAKRHKLSIDQAKTALGYWLTANYVPQQNAFLKQKDQTAINEARAAYAAAQAINAASPTPTRQQTEADSLAALNRAIALARDRAAEIADPDLLRSQFEIGVAGGLTDAQAAMLKADIESRIPAAELRRAGQDVWAMMSWKRDLDLRTGKITAQQVASWPNHPEYVPTTGDPRNLETDDIFSTGSLNQQADKSVGGRRSSVAQDGLDAAWESVGKSAAFAGYQDFKSQLNQAWEQAIARAMSQGATRQGAAEIAQRELGMRRLAGEPNLATNTQDEIILREAGQPTWRFQLEDPALLEALKRENLEQTNKLLEVAGTPTRWFARIATQLTPGWSLVNLFRDVMERSEVVRTKTILDRNGRPINTNKVGRAILAGVLSPEVVAAAHRRAFGFNAQGTQAGRDLEELIRLGGVSTWGDYLEKSNQDFRDAVKRDALLAKLSIAGKLPEAYVKFFTNQTEATELMTVLSAYRAIKAQGVDPKDAAAATLDLLNFRRRGAYTGPLRALYAFANPALQGGANLANYLSTRRGQVRFTAYTLGMMGLYSMLREGDDEDEGGKKLDQQGYSLERNILLPIGDGKYAAVPAPFGAHQLAWSTATNLVRAMAGDLTWGEASGEIAKGAIKQGTPVSPSEVPISRMPGTWLLQTLAPTMLKGVTNLGLDTDAFGRKISPAFPTKELRAEQGRPSTAEFWDEVAVDAQRMWGIDAYPEQWKELVRSYAVGPFRQLLEATVENPNRERLGRETTPPIVGTFIKRENQFALMGQARDAAEQLRMLSAERTSRKQRDDLSGWITNEIERKLSLADWYLPAVNKLSGQKARITRQENSGAISEAIAEQRRQLLDREREALDRRLVAQYRTIEGRPTTATAGAK